MDAQVLTAQDRRRKALTLEAAIRFAAATATGGRSATRRKEAFDRLIELRDLHLVMEIEAAEQYDAAMEAQRTAYRFHAAEDGE